MTKTEPIADLVTQAKSAVTDLEEPYRMEAFKIILDNLMSGSEPAVVGSARIKSKVVKKKNKTRSQSQRKSIKTIAKSELNLSTDQLQNLKVFYQAYLPKGGELCVFVLSMFIHEALKKEVFNEADIESLYRSLISMKVKVHAVSNFSQNLNWLCAKSRKREWLNRDGTDFVVTNAGLITFNEMEKKV